MTWDGQPAGEMGAAIEAVIAAAWRAGRDAAAALCLAKNEGRRHLSFDSRAHDPDDLACEIADLMPPPDLAAALAEHTRRAVEAEREAIAAWLETAVYRFSLPSPDTGPFTIMDTVRDEVIAQASAAIRARTP